MNKKILISFLILISGINTAYSIGFKTICTSDGINIIAAGEDGLIFRSTNAGSTWASYTLPSANFKDASVINDNVWIAGDGGKIYKTVVQNSAVSEYSLGIINSLNSVSFVNNNTGFVCGDGGIVYKTVNGGLNWNSSSTGIAIVDLNGISFINELEGAVAGNNGTVYTTTNGGSNWQSISPGTTKNLLNVKYFPDGISVTGEYGALYIKPDGQSWTSVNTRIDTDINGISGQGINDIHICGGGGFIRNNKNGDAKFYTFEANPMIANLVDIFYFNESLGFAVSSLNNAIIKTTNGGVNWSLTAGTSMTYQWQLKLTPSMGGIGNTLCRHPADRNAVFVVYGGLVYVSRDRGNTWNSVATIQGVTGRVHSFYVSPLDTNIWVAAITGNPDKIVKSVDHGVTWTTSIQKNFSNYGQPLEMDQNDPNIFYFAPDNGGFYRSTDIGSTFTEISNNFGFRSPCDIIVAWDSSNIILLADGDTGFGKAKMWRSVNGGMNWDQVLNFSSSESPSMCTSIFTKNKFYATEWPGTYFYKSQNYGSSWGIQMSTGFTGWGSAVCSEDPNVILVGSYGTQSVFTYDNENYTEVNSLDFAGAGMLIPDKNMIIAMQTGALFRLSANYSVITSVSENIIPVAVPQEYRLHQNYPNPFNPTTQIKIEIPSPGNVSLKIYDQLGREVRTLMDGFRTAGIYEIDFNAASLSSGVYFYSFTADEINITRKMLLLK